MLNWADYAILGVMGFSILISVVRGFVREAISLASWIFAFWLVFQFSSIVSNLLTSYIASSTLRYIAACGLLFLSALILGAIVNYMVSQLVDKTGLSGTDRVLGILFGAGRGILLISILLLGVRLTPAVAQPWWQSAVLIPYFQPMEAWLQTMLPSNVSTRLTASPDKAGSQQSLSQEVTQSIVNAAVANAVVSQQPPELN